MNFNDLKKYLAGQPGFRLKQAKQLIFSQLIGDWAEATTLPLVLRNELGEKLPLAIDGQVKQAKKSEAQKAVIKLADGRIIETVLLHHQDGRNTVCVSSQVGCPLACSFCATGKLGFQRNLSSAEIVDQVLYFARQLKKQQQKVTNVVFMGMGEPMLNYDRVLEAINILHDPDGFNLGARRFSISTSGITAGINRLVDESLEINLAISLNAPSNSLRSKLMPINKREPLAKVMSSVEDYIGQTRRRVMLEYVMISGINDSDRQAEELAGLLSEISLCFVNLVTYNPTKVFSPSEPERVERFKKILNRAGISAISRFRLGDEIDAACGQLAGK